MYSTFSIQYEVINYELLLGQVGTGFSFTDDDKGFAQNQDDVGRDLYR